MARKPTPAELEKEADRKRQAERRERKRLAGEPLTGVVDRVIVEAMAFELARTKVRADQLATASVNVGDMLKTALRILSKREGYNRDASKAALASRLAKRPEHDDAGCIPSLHPDAGVPAIELARRRQTILEEYLLDDCTPVTSSD